MVAIRINPVSLWKDDGGKPGHADLPGPVATQLAALSVRSPLRHPCLSTVPPLVLREVRGWCDQASPPSHPRSHRWCRNTSWGQPNARLRAPQTPEVLCSACDLQEPSRAPEPEPEGAAAAPVQAAAAAAGAAATPVERVVARTVKYNTYIDKKAKEERERLAAARRAASGFNAPAAAAPAISASQVKIVPTKEMMQPRLLHLHAISLVASLWFGWDVCVDGAAPKR